jgi:hypothetical protein
MGGMGITLGCQNGASVTTIPGWGPDVARTRWVPPPARFESSVGKPVMQGGVAVECDASGVPGSEGGQGRNTSRVPSG